MTGHKKTKTGHIDEEREERRAIFLQFCKENLSEKEVDKIIDHQGLPSLSTLKKYPEYYSKLMELEAQNDAVKELQMRMKAKAEQQAGLQNWQEKLELFLTLDGLNKILPQLSVGALVLASNSFPSNLPELVLSELKRKWPNQEIGALERFVAHVQSEVRVVETEEVIGDQFEFCAGYWLVPNKKYLDIFPTRTIKERVVYTDLNKWIMDRCLETNAVVVGDPGIGKSTMLKVLFIKLKLSGETVFWVMESGRWVHHSNNVITTGTDAHLKKNLWISQDVWLLIDGKVSDVYLLKMRKAVVFSSPQKSNYHKFLKATSAMKLVLPPWTRDEVVSLFSEEHKSSTTKFPNGSPGFEMMMPFWRFLKAALKNASSKCETTHRTISRTNDVEQSTSSKVSATNTDETSMSENETSNGSGQKQVIAMSEIQSVPPKKSDFKNNHTSIPEGERKSTDSVSDYPKTFTDHDSSHESLVSGNQSISSKESDTKKDEHSTSDTATRSKEGSVSSKNSIELSNLPKILSYSDFQMMKETMDAISTKTYGLLSPKQVLEHLTFPMPKRVSRRLVLLIVRSLHNSSGEEMYQLVHDMVTVSRKRKPEDHELFFTKGSHLTLKLLKASVYELEREFAGENKKFIDAVLKNNFIMEYVNYCIKYLSQLFREQGLKHSFLIA
jgi:hypothetical protein